MRNTGPGGKQTVLDLGRQEGLAVLVNRPLNAMPAGGRGILRLAELPFDEGPVDLAAQFQKVAGLETEYRDIIAPSIQHAGQGTPPSEYFNWAEELRKIQPQLQGLEHWEQIEQRMIAPHINQVLQAVPRLVTGQASEQWEEWRERYVPELLTLLRGLRHEATERSRNRTARVTGLIDPLLPEHARHESLSRKALWILASTPGVTCVLNGMRTVNYVNESLEVLKWKPLDVVLPIYERIKTVTLS
jgi:hypothetical protein